MSDFKWMTEAFELALKAERGGEIPVGAILIDAENQPIGYGYNGVIHTHDPTAHAEIVAIRMAANQLQNYRLDNTTLYVTLEPCFMCVGAIMHARIKRVVFGTRDFKSGAAGSMCNLFSEKQVNHFVQVDEGILQEKCSTLLVDFFKEKRGYDGSVKSCAVHNKK